MIRRLESGLVVTGPASSFVVGGVGVAHARLPGDIGSIAYGTDYTSF